MWSVTVTSIMPCFDAMWQIRLAKLKTCLPWPASVKMTSSLSFLSIQGKQSEGRSPHMLVIFSVKLPKPKPNSSVGASEMALSLSFTRYMSKLLVTKNLTEVLKPEGPHARSLVANHKGKRFDNFLT